MKKILNISLNGDMGFKFMFFAFLFLFTSIEAQNTRFNAYADLATITAAGNNNFDISYTNISYGSKTYPASLYDDSELGQTTAMWFGCTRFKFLSVMSLAPITLRFKDENGTLADLVSNGGYQGQRIAILQELFGTQNTAIAGFVAVADGNSGFISGIAPDQYTCMQNHYARNFRDHTFNGINYTTWTTQEHYCPSDNIIIRRTQPLYPYQNGTFNVRDKINPLNVINLGNNNNLDTIQIPASILPKVSDISALYYFFDSLTGGTVNKESNLVRITVDSQYCPTPILATTLVRLTDNKDYTTAYPSTIVADCATKNIVTTLGSGEYNGQSIWIEKLEANNYTINAAFENGVTQYVLKNKVSQRLTWDNIALVWHISF